MTKTVPYIPWLSFTGGGLVLVGSSQYYNHKKTQRGIGYTCSQRTTEDRVCQWRHSQRTTWTYQHGANLRQWTDPCLILNLSTWCQSPAVDRSLSDTELINMVPISSSGQIPVWYSPLYLIKVCFNPSFKTLRHGNRCGCNRSNHQSDMN